MNNQKNMPLMNREEFENAFLVTVKNGFNDSAIQNYLDIKKIYLEQNSEAEFLTTINSTILKFVININNYIDQENAYLWQEFFIKNENISPVSFVSNGYENIPVVAFFLDNDKPVFKRIYQHLKKHPEWNIDIIISNPYVIAKMVEFDNRDFLHCIRESGFTITDDTAKIYLHRGSKKILQFLFDHGLLNPHNEESFNITQEVFRTILRKESSFMEIDDSFNYFKKLNVKPGSQTLNYLSLIFNKEYARADKKENIFENSYFFHYFNQQDNVNIYKSNFTTNCMITDILDSDEDEDNNKETLNLIIAFLKNKNIFPDWSDFQKHYSTYGKYYSSEGTELQFLKEILINNAKEQLKTIISSDNIKHKEKAVRL